MKADLTHQLVWWCLHKLALVSTGCLSNRGHLSQRQHVTQLHNDGNTCKVATAILTSSLVAANSTLSQCLPQRSSLRTVPLYISILFSNARAPVAQLVRTSDWSSGAQVWILAAGFHFQFFFFNIHSIGYSIWCPYPPQRWPVYENFLQSIEPPGQGTIGPLRKACMNLWYKPSRYPVQWSTSPWTRHILYKLSRYLIQ